MDRPENCLSPPEIGVWLPDMEDRTSGRVGSHGFSRIRRFGSLSPDLSVSLLSLRSLSLSPESFSLDISLWVCSAERNKEERIEEKR
jgi:hypothetical protein